MDSPRQARRRWPVTVVRLGEEDDDLSATTTVRERIAAMWPLAVEAHTLAVKPVPTYERKQAPSRVFWPGEARPDDEP
jgi:hypothetical protein